MEEENVKNNSDTENSENAAENISEIYERQSRRYSKNLDVGNEVK